MSSFINQIEIIIETYVSKFIKSITENYQQTNENELLKMWTACLEGKKLDIKLKSKEESSNQHVSISGCPYKYIKGDKLGKNCGTKAKDGNIYCSIHKKYEGLEKKEKKILPERKKTSEPKVEPKVETKTALQKISSKSELGSQPILRKHKITNRLYHPESLLVFKSSSEKVVVGKIVDDQVQKLSSKDIELCKKYFFRFENDCFEETESEKEDISKIIGQILKTKITEENESRNKSVNDSEDEDEKPKVDIKTKVAPKKSVEKPKVESDSDSDSEDEKPKVDIKTKVAPKKIVEKPKFESDSDSEDEKPKVDIKTKVAPKKSVEKPKVESDSDSEDEKPKVDIKTKVAPKKIVEKPKVESDSDSEDEKTKVDIKTKIVPKKFTEKKVESDGEKTKINIKRSKIESDSESDSDSKTKGKFSGKKQIQSDSDSEDEETNPKRLLNFKSNEHDKKILDVLGLEDDEDAIVSE